MTTTTIDGAQIDVLADLGAIPPFVLDRDYLDLEGGAELTPVEESLVSLTAEVVSIDASWGASDWMGPLTSPDTGVCTLELYDPERRYDPGNPLLGQPDPDVTGRLGAPVVIDYCARTGAPISGGWGTPDTAGPAWVTWGSGVVFVQAGSWHRMDFAADTGGSGQAQTGPSGTNLYRDVSATFVMNPTALIPAGKSLQCGVMLRRAADGSHYYFASLVFRPDGTVQLNLRSTKAGVNRTIATYDPPREWLYPGAWNVIVRMWGAPAEFWMVAWPQSQAQPAWQIAGVIDEETASGPLAQAGSVCFWQWSNGGPISLAWDTFYCNDWIQPVSSSPPAPGRELAVMVDGQPVWTGATSEIVHDLGSAITTITAVDAFAAAGRIGVTVLWAKGPVSTQLEVLRLAAAWPADRWRIVGALTAFRDTERFVGSFLEGLHRLVRAELGDMWVDRQGRITIRGRGVAPDSAPILEIGTGPAPGPVDLEHIVDRRLVNAVYLDVTAEESADRVWRDPVSVAAYGEAAIEASEDELLLWDGVV